MFNYKIRLAEHRDIESIIDLCDEHAKFEGCNYDRKNKARNLFVHLFSRNSVKCVVVENENEIKGYATYMKEFSTWDAAYYMHMDCLYLKPSLRGRGIGRQIMEIIYSEAKSTGCINVQWQTPEDNYPAIEFYQKLKAKPKKKLRFYLDCQI